MPKPHDAPWPAAMPRPFLLWRWREPGELLRVSTRTSSRTATMVRIQRHPHPIPYGETVCYVIYSISIKTYRFKARPSSNTSLLALEVYSALQCSTVLWSVASSRVNEMKCPHSRLPQRLRLRAIANEGRASGSKVKVVQRSMRKYVRG